MTTDFLPHTDFDGAFTANTVFVRGEDEWTMDPGKWGTLATPTGKLVVCDALGPGRVKPFKRTVQPGKYPVDIAWNGSETCALRVRFSRRKTVVWEPALRKGEKRTKDSVHFPCFGVDSGMAGVFDSKAAQVASRDAEAWSSRVDKEQSIVVDSETGAGMVWCFSGYGDGGYPSFWGLDRTGEVTCLVLDFLVLVEGIYDEHVVTDLLAKSRGKLNEQWFADSGLSDVQLKWSRHKSELRLEYRGAEPLEVTLLNSRGKPIHHGSSGTSGASLGDPNCLHFFSRTIDLVKEKRAKLVLRRFTGMRSLPRHQ